MSGCVVGKVREKPNFVRVFSQRREVGRIAELFASDSSVCFLIETSKNDNVVVYAGNIQPETGKLNPKTPMVVYWLTWDAEFTAQKRKKGIQSDKEDLTTIERQLAFGLSSKKVSDRENEYEISLAALPSRKLRLTQTEDGKPRGTLEINGKQTLVRQIYVSATFGWGLPSVKYVELTGVDEAGHAVSERVNNK
eukprot:GDKI01021214.1.p1 GENE.GDKI01021214.1~~GDKI01021214.1.p1  ORF type:complete len:194 (-),score=63.05 GDKI01021214.1:173-754(-)